MIISLLKIALIAVDACVMGSLSILCVPFDKNEAMMFAIFRGFARSVLRIGGVSVAARGAEHLAAGQNYLYVANHASYFDIPAVVAAIPDNVRFVYKKELNKVPFWGWGLKITGYNIGINRSSGHDAMQSLEDLAERMRRGASVCLFAEGTRTSDGNLQQFKRGPFNLAVKTGVPIVPVTIQGSFNIMSRNSLRIHPGTVTVVIGEPIAPVKANGKETEFELRDRVRSIIEHTLASKG